MAGEHRSEVIWRMMLSLTAAVLLGGWLLFTAASSGAQSNDDCLGCHGSPEILSTSREERAIQVTPAPPGKSVIGKLKKRESAASLFVDAGIYSASIHGGLECTACHQDASQIPHEQKLKAVDCSACHQDVAKTSLADVHGRALATEMESGRNEQAPTCQDCHGGHDIRGVGDPASHVHPLNQARTCGRCHQDQDLVTRYRITIPAPVKAYERSIHARAIMRGEFKAAACSSCHSAHGILPAADPKSTVSRAKEPATCGSCHSTEARKYQGSIHGLAVKRGNLDSPTCSGCHNEHEILSHKEPSSPGNGAVISTATCARCHGAEKINQKYGLPADKVRTYLGSYHGLATRAGDITAANCASCHGLHDIKPSSDPTSKTNPANLAATCGMCHSGATDRFASIPVHTSPSVQGFTTADHIQYWVRLFYLVLIPTILGFMLFHNGIDYLKKIRVRYSQWRRAGGHLRMTRDERIQHAVLMVTFTILVLSGFALTFHWGLPFLEGDLNQKLRYWVHRAAALCFMAYMLYHFVWLLATGRGRGWLRDMIPSFRDLRDLWRTLLYNLGLASTKPRFGRFSYVEKMEYGALLWGSALMILTGLILWFKREATAVIPPWGFNVANVIHYYEAVLAALAIVVWHFYAVVFNPDVAPMAMHWITGTVPEGVLENQAVSDSAAPRGESVAIKVADTPS
jgi:cytochrome b subunit of formate dehydrogenase